MEFEEYRDGYSALAMRRINGILEVRLHTGGKSLVYEERLHHQLGPAFRAIADDRDNRVVILTGTGDAFCTRINLGSLRGLLSTAEGWDRVIFVAKQMLQALLDIDVPIVAAINGPVLLHTEIPLLADIVVATEDTEFADLVHAPNGVIPGDGVHAIWPLLLGVNRARYFLLTGQRIPAAEALRLGIVGEVVDKGRSLERAWEIAELLAAKPHAMLRQTRGVLRLELERSLREYLERGFAREALGALGSPPVGTEPEGAESQEMVEDYLSGTVIARGDYLATPEGG